MEEERNKIAQGLQRGDADMILQGVVQQQYRRQSVGLGWEQLGRVWHPRRVLPSATFGKKSAIF
jgi:hypothetical protein